MPASEALFLAERLDLAGIRGEEVSLDTWWDEGQLTGDRKLVEAAFAKHLEEENVAA